jgi:hypothetical protein
VDRKTIKLGFTRDRIPDWTCPTCLTGLLTLKKESFFSDERCYSRDHGHEAWDPEWIEYTYSCLLYCGNEKCKEVVASSGVGSVDWSMGQDENGEYQEFYEDYFKPKHFQPALKLITLPSDCPESVKSLIEDSFCLFFQSPSAAANCIRAAVEQLLTELKIKRFNSTNGKRRIISLHQRIALLPNHYSEVRDLILAIKWLGNAGSHSQDALTMDDVLDAYELLEHVLQEIYAQKAKKMKALAKKINKRAKK